RLLRQEPVTEPRSGAGPDLRARWGLDAGHRLVGITARVQPQRRFDLLWQVARRVCAALPAVRFVLLGRGNERDTRTLVTEPIAALGLQQQVVLPGYLREPDYSAALRALDVFLFLVPGSDGTCRAVREAMATGLPVVATQRGMLPELLGPRPHGGGPVGFACAEDAVPIADRLLELLGDDALRRQLGGNALQLTRDCMDPVQAARALANFYEQLLSQRGGGPLQ
ncbi:MAG TPA: glycosyltransferase, partial [Planctomycetota bacterium]|nr:glycosyltransferase [Planctomycetota bacterium]